MILLPDMQSRLPIEKGVTAQINFLFEFLFFFSFLLNANFYSLASLNVEGVCKSETGNL